MLPAYPDIPRYHHHHHHCVSHQEPPLPNPTVLHMPAASLDEHVQFFPAEMYHQETLEAVLWQPVTAPVRAEMEPGNGAQGDGINGRGGAVGAPRKRPFRTDRHSKIRTAQGVRDRRMRLSVGVARDFFALQDLLGFDKPSKTVDWLLTQSKPAIDRLADAAPGAAVPGAAAAGAVKEKGEAAASSSSTDYFRDAREDARALASERTTSERMKNIDGYGGSQMVLMPEHGGGEVDWFMSEATSAVAIEQPMDGLDYYYQYYQLEEMMRAATTEDD